MSCLFFTIGHSNRTVDELAHLLAGAGANLLADVRSIPRSRANPQFNVDALPAALTPYGIAYRHLARLGGLRSRGKAAGASPNTLWQNTSFRNYADYAMTPAFAEGLAELQQLSEQHVCAIMCAEAVWWRCHRRIIADYLIAGGATVMHILGPGRTEPARLTPGAMPTEGGVLVYPEVAAKAAPKGHG